MLGLAATTAVWLAVWTYLVPTTPRRQVVAYVGRTALAFVLTWLNPFYAVFAFVGFLDVFDVFSGRRAYPFVLVVAVTMAGSQSRRLCSIVRVGGDPFRGAPPMDADDRSPPCCESGRHVDPEVTSIGGCKRWSKWPAGSRAQLA